MKEVVVDEEDDEEEEEEAPATFADLYAGKFATDEGKRLTPCFGF